MATASSRVVVTGLGAMTPLGLDLATTWEGLITGRSGIDYITHFDTNGFDTTFAAEVMDFDATQYVGRKEARRMDRFSQLAVAASLQSLEHAGLEINDSNSEHVGVLVGSGIGGLVTVSEQVRVLAERGPDKVSPFTVPMMIADMASAQVSIVLLRRVVKPISVNITGVSSPHKARKASISPST